MKRGALVVICLMTILLVVAGAIEASGKPNHKEEQNIVISSAPSDSFLQTEECEKAIHALKKAGYPNPVHLLREHYIDPEQIEDEVLAAEVVDCLGG